MVDPKTIKEFKNGSFKALRSLIRSKYDFKRKDYRDILDILYQYSNKKYIVSFKSTDKRNTWSKSFNLSNKEYTEQIAKALLSKYWESAIESG